MFNDTQLMKALYDIQDILERALCPFVLLSDTAKSLADGLTLKGDGIYIGVLKKHITKEALSTIKTYLKDEEIREDGFDYEWSGVPIHVQFISNKYPFFENLDFKFYMASQYNMPNPFKEYWEIRETIS